MPFTAAEIAKHVDGQVLGDGSLVLNGFAPADRARPGDLTFAENENYFARAEESAASAVLIDGPFSSKNKVLIRVQNSRVAFARVLPLFFPDPILPPGTHPTAVVSPKAQIGSGCHIGPYCVIGDHVRLGARCVLQAGNFIGPNS